MAEEKKLSVISYRLLVKNQETINFIIIRYACQGMRIDMEKSYPLIVVCY